MGLNPSMKNYKTGNCQFSEAYKCGKSSFQSGSFHGGGNTYANQEAYVKSLGNKWATENFNATRPYFSGD